MMRFEIDGHIATQPLYFCDKVDRIYFSKQGCMEANILSPSFPFPMQYKEYANKATTVEQSSTNGQPQHPSSGPSIQAAVDAGSDNIIGQDVIQPTPHVERTPPPPRPEQPPFPPIVENIPKLETFIKQQFASSAFNKSPPFPAMNAPPAHIHLLPNSKPYARHSPINVPRNWEKEVKAMLDRNVELEIIAVAPIGSSVTWCSPMVIVQKTDGSPRLTVDFQRLNANCLRETHHTPSPFMLAMQIPPHQWKTVLDAVDGYHAIKLDEESQWITMFITQWGRYIFLRMPQGYLASGDAYTRRFDEIIKDIKRKVKIIDDTLLYDNTIEEAFFATWDYLTLCANNGIVMNVSKFKFCREAVEFAGLLITPTGPAPSERILQAIRDFPIPTDITGARSWFGLVNQVAWAYSISPVMQPFREAIKPNRTFYWDANLTNIFEKSKKLLIDMVKDGVQTFDTSRKTCLQTDWSKEGIGYLLLQKYCKCNEITPVCCPEGWKLVFAGSRFLTPTESRYSPTEGEALAVSWSLKHSRMFTLGCSDLLIVVDHKPLLGILNDRDLDNITNPRIQNLKQATLGWRFKISYCPGKWQRGPDALSRYPSQKPCIAAVNEIQHTAHLPICDMEDPVCSAPTSLFHLICENPTETDIQASDATTIQAMSAFINSISSHTETISIDEVKHAACADKEYLDLLDLITNGFPQSRNKVHPTHLREFWSVHERLSCIEGVALMDTRVVIPRSLRKQILANLHTANQGISGMKARANQTVYWPGMDAQMRNFKDACSDCLANSPSQQAEPIVLTPSPDWPFQQICVDYFELQVYMYLSIVDRFSGWLNIYHMKQGNSTSQKLISICRDLFIQYGAAEELSSDGGPQFTAQRFQEFLKSWGVKHRRSSVGYPQSNGRAEVGVKAAKRIIHNNLSADGSLDNDRAARAILQYRNTPLPDINLSPAQILLHRQLRDCVPAIPSHYNLHKEWVLSAKEREVALAMRTQKVIDNYNRKTRSLPPISLGAHVVVQTLDRGKKKWVKSGKVVEVLDNRQYRIRMDGSGRVTLQNRRYIRECHPITSPILTPSPFAPMVTPAVVPDPQPMEQHPGQQQLAPQPEQPTEGLDHQTYPTQHAQQHTQEHAQQHVQENAPQQEQQHMQQGANQHAQASDEQPALEPAQKQTSSEGSGGRPRGVPNRKTRLNQQRVRNLRGGRNQEEREDTGS